jgi:hypothetical protein
MQSIKKSSSRKDQVHAKSCLHHKTPEFSKTTALTRVWEPSKSILCDDVSNTARVGTHYLQWPTRLAMVEVRVPIGGVFLKDVTELKACQIYKAVLQTINNHSLTEPL